MWSTIWLTKTTLTNFLALCVANSSWCWHSTSTLILIVDSWKRESELSLFLTKPNK